VTRAQGHPGVPKCSRPEAGPGSSIAGDFDSGNSPEDELRARPERSLAAPRRPGACPEGASPSAARRDARLPAAVVLDRDRAPVPGDAGFDTEEDRSKEGLALERDVALPGAGEAVTPARQTRARSTTRIGSC